MSIKMPPPPSNKVNKKGEPPSILEIRNNLQIPEPTKIVALNFRVSAEFKRDFKIASAIKGISQSELLKIAFEEWQKRNS